MMSITIGNLSFDGPFAGASQLLPRSGVYAILGRGATGGNWIVVDVGESGDVKARVENHDRKPHWQGNGHATLGVAAFYCDAATRTQVEQALRQQYNPACGDR
jgi:hypothetical protein